MLNNRHKNKCPFGDEIVSYIYDEIRGSKRSKFEDHLAGCSVCTDEFAAVSEARLSMFEWRRDEFADLSTPEIIIPYEVTQPAADITYAGWLAGLRGLLSLTNFPVAAAAAMVILALGIGLVALRYVDRSEQPVASGILTTSAAESRTVPVTQVGAEPEKKSSELAAANPIRARNDRNDVQPVRVAVRRQPLKKTPLLAQNAVKLSPAQIQANAPVLSNYEDASDNSLRLADLFADLDS